MDVGATAMAGRLPFACKCSHQETDHIAELLLEPGAQSIAARRPLPCVLAPQVRFCVCEGLEGVLTDGGDGTPPPVRSVTLAQSRLYINTHSICTKNFADEADTGYGSNTTLTGSVRRAGEQSIISALRSKTRTPAIVYVPASGPQSQFALPAGRAGAAGSAAL